MTRRPTAALVALALLLACAPRPEDATPGEGIPIEVARFADMRGGSGVAAPSPHWFQQRMALALKREGFAPRQLAYDEPPSGEGLSIEGRLDQLPSTVELDDPPGEVSFRVEVRRGGQVVLARFYQNKVWWGFPETFEWSNRERALRDAVDQSLSDLVEDLKRVAAAPAPAPPDAKGAPGGPGAPGA